MDIESLFLLFGIYGYGGCYQRGLSHQLFFIGTKKPCHRERVIHCSKILRYG